MPSAPVWAIICAVIAAFAPMTAAQARDVTVSRLGASQSLTGVEARFALDILAEPQVFVLPAPQPRLVIDLPAALIETDKGISTRGTLPLGENGLRVRFARHQPRMTRLVFDLPQAARLGAVARAVEGGSVQFSILLHFEHPQPERKQPLEKGSAPLIVLDAGHGGTDPGASGAAGQQEKAVTLAAAHELKSLLLARGYRVQLTRQDDSFISLEQRVELAKSWGADLFLSLHADAAQQASTAGASVYTLSARGGERTRRLRDAKDWILPEKTPQITNILFDLTLHAGVDQSKMFSSILQNHLRGKVPLLRNSERGAEFYVLLAPGVPAVLLEMGFITNPGDAQRLSTATGRGPMLRAVAAAIGEHFAVPTLLAAKD